jgi:hypothetical protein
MKAKAELIQASNNLATNEPIFTFKFVYPRKHWLDLFGLSKYFDKRLSTRYIVTASSFSTLLERAYGDANVTVILSLQRQVKECVEFSKKIFTATNPNNYGAAKRLTGADVQKAIDLFGPRLQQALKQYKPGESHRPLYDHSYLATESGWLKESPKE